MENSELTHKKEWYDRQNGASHLRGESNLGLDE